MTKTPKCFLTVLSLVTKRKLNFMAKSKKDYNYFVIYVYTISIVFLVS